MDYLIVGLGNPGRRYRLTRHNAGFLALDRMAEKLKGRWRKDDSSRAEIASLNLGEVKILLAKPQTFMNQSGITVDFLLRRHRLPTERVVVVVDDMALAPGLIRIRPRGNSGGHNGLKSVISLIGGEFPRVRIGIGRPGLGEDIVEYVLDRFSPAEWERIEPALDRAVEAVQTLILEGIDEAMNRYNRKNETG